jgi:hypothetical protein
VDCFDLLTKCLLNLLRAVLHDYLPQYGSSPGQRQTLGTQELYTDPANA